MFESLLNTAVLTNPAFIAAIFAVIRNVGGYAYNCFEAKKILPYSASQFLVTLGVWETLFVLLSSGAGLDTATTAALAIVLDFLRSLKTTIGDAVKARSP